MTKRRSCDTIIIMIEQRKALRLDTLARVTIKGLEEREFFLKDISVTGCRAECACNAAIEKNTQYQVEIFPESGSKIEAFEFLAESKWVKIGAESSEIGLSIIQFPQGVQFQYYVDYLAWRYAHGISITGAKL